MSRQCAFQAIAVRRAARLLCAACLLCCPWLARATSGDAADAPVAVVRPADVLARVTLLAEHAEQIRWHMGRPQATLSPLRILDAAPREVYFQALSLYRKADQLAYELTGLRKPAPPRPADRLLQPADVRMLVDAALERLAQVADFLELAPDFEEREMPADTRPTDVYSALLVQNRQLNLLLERPVSSTDNYWQAEEALLLVDGLLRHAGLESRVRQSSLMLGGQTPKDAFQRLSNCLNLLERVLANSDLHMLRFVPVHAGEVNAGDVDGLVALLISELSYLQDKAGIDAPENLPTDDRRRYPSDVVRIIAAIERKIARLVQHSTDHPGWLQ